MIIRELYRTREDGVRLFRSYSNEGFKIKQLETGDIYDDAIDVESANYTYEEVEEKVEVREPDELDVEHPVE